MTPEQFRRLARALPAVEEREHHGHPDFRVGGKVFATIGPEGDWAMVRLPADEQAALVDGDPDAFEPMPGAWGKQGCTRVWLAKARKAGVEPALRAAWRHRATRALLREHGED